MSRIITAGIDIGSSMIKVVVAEKVADATGKEIVKIIATGKAESKGIRHGYVVNKPEVAESINQAIREASKVVGLPIRKVFLGISGLGLTSVISNGSTIISRADAEITPLDLEKALTVSQSNIGEPNIINRKIIHAIPLSYKIDSKVALGSPLGMKGMKLEVRTLFVTCLEHHLNDLIEVVEEAGLDVIDVTPSPFAAALVMLSKAQRIAGSILCNIGAETTSIAVYENNLPISLEIFPLGGSDITNDLALGLRINLDEAEQVKLGSVVGGNYSRRKLDEIVAARLSDIFDLVENHLKKIGKAGLLPAGIVLTGGSASFPSIEEFARSFLRLPAKAGTMPVPQEQPIKDSTWAVAYGLCLYGFSSGDTNPLSPQIGKGVMDVVKKIIRWFKQFLP